MPNESNNTGLSVSSISKTVDKTKVGLNENFNYTITSSFSGITGNLGSAKVEDFIPNNINYTLPPVTPPIQSITQTPQAGGTLLTFNLNPNEAYGQTVNINVGASFKPSNSYNTTFTNKSNLYVNGALDSSSSAPPVTYTNKADFHLQKQLLSPFSQNPAPGSTVIYALNLKNLLEGQGGTGIAGSSIKNVNISDILPKWLTVDPSFLPVGQDEGPYDSASPQYNGLTGTVNTENNSINFTLPEYNGTDYVIYFRARVNADVPVGTVVNNTANWNADGENKTPASNNSTVSQPSAQSNVGKSGPAFAAPGDQIVYQLTPNNVGNTDLSNVSIIDTLPEGFTPTSVTTGSYTLTPANIPVSGNVTLQYSTNGGSTYTTVGVYPSGSSKSVNLPTLPTGERYTNIKWVVSKIPCGVNIGNGPTVNGTVSQNYTKPTLTNSAVTTYNTPEGPTTSGVGSVTTQISNKSVGSLIKSVDKTTASPGDEVNYTLNLSTQSTVTGPILADLLPAGVSFEGMTASLFSNGATGESNNNPPITVTTLNNYNNSGRTLVRFTFPKDFKAPQNSTIAVYFTGKISSSTSGNLSNTGVFGNATGTVEAPDGTPPTTDNNDLVGNGLPSQPVVESNPTSTQVAGINSLSCNKYVKGSLDKVYSTYPDSGDTTDGGSLNYKIVIKNSTPYNSKDIEIVDILPHVGDTGVIVNQARESQFPVYPNGPVQAVLSPPDPNNPNPDLEIEYSTSYDPIRFSSKDTTGESVGTGTWTSIMPDPPTKIASLKLTSPNTILKPGQSIILTIPAMVPPGVKPGDIAWNSFAYRDSLYNPNTSSYQPQLPAEPIKVGIKISASSPEDAEIGDYVWYDANHNGLQDSDEKGINGVKVNLLNSAGQVVATTYTTTNPSTGKSGYYLFGGLKPGTYHVQFIKPDGYDFTTPNVGTDDSKNSCATPSTGMSGAITLTAGEKYLDADAGLYKPTTPPEPPTTPCHCSQSVIDVIESIALEETALSHIINAEGEKIQKMLKLNPTKQDILNVNASVKQTINAITKLELVLSQKLQSAKKLCNCDSSCSSSESDTSTETQS